MRTHRTLLAVAVAMAAALSALASAAPAVAQAPSDLPPYGVIADNGFNTPQNDYSWSMAWFKGKLYVGTARSEQCVEEATEIFYFPTEPYLYSTNPEPGATCPANEYDLILSAQIWQYTPQTQVWRLVFDSPQNIPNPRAPGKFVARDIGFRGMVVYDGQLYIGDVTPDEYIPELASAYPPRILRTSNGTSFTSFNAPSTIHTYLGVQKPIGFRAMTVFDNRMYVTASSGITGDGVILAVSDPAGANPTYTQVSPTNQQVFELQPFNGQLYAGTGSSANLGYGVYKTDGSLTSPTWTPVVTGGAGLGGQITSVVSMGVFRGELYVGASGWYNTLFPASEMIRIAPDGSWDVVVGSSRKVDGVTKAPISGLPDGFGNVFNAHFWRMDVFNGGLFVGTNDWSYALQTVPIVSTLLQNQFGFDMYGTCDGRYWYPVTTNAFGSGIDNFGLRTMEPTPYGNFLGSANHAQGTTIYGSTINAPSCGVNPFAGGSFQPEGGPARSALPARPARLLTDVQGRGTVLSWQPTPGAARYEVMRATPRTIPDVPLLRRTLLAGGAVPDNPPGPSGAVGSVTINGQPTAIATTTEPYFVDHGAPAGSEYEVVAVSASGRTSAPSNLAAGPSPTTPATLGALW